MTIQQLQARLEQQALQAEQGQHALREEMRQQVRPGWVGVGAALVACGPGLVSRGQWLAIMSEMAQSSKVEGDKSAYKTRPAHYSMQIS